MNDLLKRILKKPLLHARWLNTLSYLENCGARKIARAEHPTKVKAEMLKHAHEESRHAYFLKKLIGKVSDLPLPNYEISSLLGRFQTIHYLDRLEIEICHLLREKKASQPKLYAYLLTTYAIEERAMKVYPLYQMCLKAEKFPFSIRSILNEEEEHLHETLDEMKLYPEILSLIEPLMKTEEKLFLRWLGHLQQEI